MQPERSVRGWLDVQKGIYLGYLYFKRKNDAFRRQNQKQMSFER